MKKIITIILLSTFLNANAQIGGGWDWAYNTGSLNHSNKHIGYNANGEMLIVGSAAGAMYLGTANVTVPDIYVATPSSFIYLAKISALGNTTILRTLENPYLVATVATTDAAGNFYLGISYSAYGGIPIDLGNGISLDGLSKVAIVKFSPTGNTLWAKSYDLGLTSGTGTLVDLSIRKLAVSSAGNVFFVGAVTNATVSPANYSVFKLDENGTTLWTKYASFLDTQTTITTFNSDKFIDDNENVYLSADGPISIVFNGTTLTAPATTVNAPIYGHFMSLDASGSTRWAYSFRGKITNLVTDKSTGNVYFGWQQTESNSNILAGLPTVALASYQNYFTGIVKCNSAGSVILTKTGAPATLFIPISGDRLLMSTTRFKNTATSFGVDYYLAADSANETNIIVESDANLDVAKVINGGKAITAGVSNLAAYGDTYGIVGYFSSITAALPTCIYGNTTLTGWNAKPNLATTYPLYANYSIKSDEAYAQFKSANIPIFPTTTWLGVNSNWNDVANWTNGVPTNAVKTVFNSGATNYPATFSTPTSGTLLVNSGATITLPTTITIAGAIKNEGTIKINNAGFFQGFGSKEWKGNGTVEFLGTAQTYSFYTNQFTNAIILNGPFQASYDMSIKGVTFNPSAGKFEMGNTIITITDPSTNSIVGANSSKYFANGTLKRALNATGIYEFPVGSSTNFQSVTINANGLGGVSSIATTFKSGAITGTAPIISYGGTTINTVLNGGSFTITPNSQPTAGTYDMTLAIKGASNSVVDPEKYTIIKRDNSTSAWDVQGLGTLATIISGTVTAKNTGLTSFSDFAIGIGSQKITLGTIDFEKEISKLKLYPNPTTSSLSITLSNSIENGSLKIISLTGQIVLQKENLSGTDFNFDVTSLSMGVYIIDITDGKTKFTNKFVKK